MAELILTDIEQPKPKFTLLDLEQRLTIAYDCIMKKQKNLTDPNFDNSIALGAVQELLSVIVKYKADLGSIDLPIETAKAITDTIQTEKPEFTVCGVQLIENGQLQGTSLYSTIVKARKIRDVLNARFAELQVKHEAKILQYPVY